MMKLELISFALCPYVQRSVIALNKKKIPFETIYIDLENPPAWFSEISPLGQVPVLRVDGKTVIFESQVINEFLDEIAPPSLHPTDAVARAKERAWIEYGSSLMGEFYSAVLAPTEAKCEPLIQEFFESLARVEKILDQGPYFRGKQFGLVDAAYAPLLHRASLTPKLVADARWRELRKVRAWTEELLKLPCVKESVRPGFDAEYARACRERDSWLFEK